MYDKTAPDLTERAREIAAVLDDDVAALVVDDSIATRDPFPMEYAEAWQIAVDLGLRDDVDGERTELGRAVAAVLASGEVGRG